MPVHNDDVARVFEKIADLLDIRGENPFRVCAYRNGAREIRGLTFKLADEVAKTWRLIRVLEKVAEVLNWACCEDGILATDDLPKPPRSNGRSSHHILTPWSCTNFGTSSCFAATTRVGPEAASSRSRSPLLHTKDTDHDHDHDNVA